MRFIKTDAHTSRKNVDTEWTGWIDRELWIRMDRIVTILQSKEEDTPSNRWIIIILDPQETMFTVPKSEIPKLQEWMKEELTHNTVGSLVEPIESLVKSVDKLILEIQYNPNIGTRIPLARDHFNNTISNLGNSLSHH